MLLKKPFFKDTIDLSTCLGPPGEKSLAGGDLHHKGRGRLSPAGHGVPDANEAAPLPLGECLPLLGPSPALKDGPLLKNAGQGVIEGH